MSVIVIKDVNPEEENEIVEAISEQYGLWAGVLGPLDVVSGND